MGYINREMEKTLLEAWQYFSVLTVTGPRQSGSSQFEVMKGVSESLAGRSGVYKLMPMSLSETREISARKGWWCILLPGFKPE